MVVMTDCCISRISENIWSYLRYISLKTNLLLRWKQAIEEFTSNFPLTTHFMNYTLISKILYNEKKTFSLTLQYQLIVLLTYFLGYSILWHLGFKSELLNVTAAEDMRDVMISMKYSTDPLACSITHFVCWHAWHVVISTMQLQNFHKHSIHTSELLDEIDV